MLSMVVSIVGWQAIITRYRSSDRNHLSSVETNAFKWIEEDEEEKQQNDSDKVNEGHMKSWKWQEKCGFIQ